MRANLPPVHVQTHESINPKFWCGIRENCVRCGLARFRGQIGGTRGPITSPAAPRLASMKVIGPRVPRGTEGLEGASLVFTLVPDLGSYESNAFPNSHKYS